MYIQWTDLCQPLGEDDNMLVGANTISGRLPPMKSLHGSAGGGKTVFLSRYAMFLMQLYVWRAGSHCGSSEITGPAY